jgi:hypothetical protein
MNQSLFEEAKYGASTKTEGDAPCFFCLPQMAEKEIPQSVDVAGED